MWGYTIKELLIFAGLGNVLCHFLFEQTNKQNIRRGLWFIQCFIHKNSD